MDNEMLDAPHEISTSSNNAPLLFNRMARVERSKASEVAPNTDIDIDMLRSEVTQLDVGQQSASALDLPSQAVPEIKRKITLDDYKRQKALANFSARAKDIVFDFDGTQSAFFHFGDLDQSDQDPWEQEFTSTPRIVLDQLSTLEFSEPYRTLLAAKIHGLRLKNLLPPFSEGENPYKFFLIFPNSEKQMVEYFAAWILACHAESQVFDSLSEGSWDCFVKNNTGKGNDKGVIFVHESQAASLHQLPFLKSIIKTGGIFFWNVSDSTSLYPLFPSIYSGPQTTVGRLRFTRLFPHGCAFLLTPSFLVAEPALSHTILNWFLKSPKSKFATAVPGTWKLVCCHNFTNYLLDLANSKAKEKEDFEREHKNSPAKDSMLQQNKLMALDSDSEFDHNDDNQNPLVQAPKWIDPDDEEGLINWFAGWS
ncbi:hypothetical protein IFR05_016955, partial [Cadophora sp. M221]